MSRWMVRLLAKVTDQQWETGARPCMVHMATQTEEKGEEMKGLVCVLGRKSRRPETTRGEEKGNVTRGKCSICEQ